VSGCSGERPSAALAPNRLIRRLAMTVPKTREAAQFLSSSHVIRLPMLGCFVDAPERTSGQTSFGDSGLPWKGDDPLVRHYSKGPHHAVAGHPIARRTL